MISQNMLQISAVMTCYNRKESTLECLRRLHNSAISAGVDLRVILVDDASTDGTTESVLNEFPKVQIIHGDGALFWNRGMHLGMKYAQQGNFDFILWINDDTHLEENAITNLLATRDYGVRKTTKEVIVVGATADRGSHKLTYGGHVATSRWKPFSFKRVWSATDPVECDAMNGNLVLIPKHIVDVVGNLDPVFEHAMGDIDYALRAKKQGYNIFVAPGFVGFCSNNSTENTYQDTKLDLSVRWRKMLSRKGLPVASWRQLTRKHGGYFWFVYFVWPYVKLVIDGTMRSIKLKNSI